MKYYFIYGGSWGNFPQFCRVASCDGYAPDYRYFYLGFRLIKTIKQWEIKLFAADAGFSIKDTAVLRTEILVTYFIMMII